MVTLATFEERIRQLMAIDNTAAQVYSELANLAEDQEAKGLFTSIARDENKHVRYSQEILALLKLYNETPQDG